MSDQTTPDPLLPCPHCGAEQENLNKQNGKGVYAYRNAPSSDMQPRLHVGCLECGSGSPSVETWNRRQVNKRECPHYHESMEARLADNERWMREVLTDFRIPFDDHETGRRLAFTQWMSDHMTSNAPARITKEMWTVVLADNGSWLPTDIFADTEADAKSVLALILSNAASDIKPERWTTDGARVTRCVLSIYPPNDQAQATAT